MTNSPVRFAVMGTGRVTRRLIADIQSTAGATVTAIASRSADRARWQADSFGIPHPVCGYDELLRRDDIDAVYVALPPSLHHEWTLVSCAAGKHVLCEKPLATNADQVREMIDSAAAVEVRLLDATAWLHHVRTDQFRQWLHPEPSPCPSEADDSEAIELRPEISEEEPSQPGFRLGPLRHLSAAVSFRSPFQDGDHRLDPNLGGGCLLDLGWYAAGLIRFAAERLPTQVYADAVNREGVLTRVSATMRFTDDLTATMSCGFDTATRKWCEIAGEDASIVCDDFTRPWPDKPARSWVHEASGKVHGMVAPTSAGKGEPTICHQERLMIGEFLRRIRSGRTDEVERQSHEQAWQTQRILDAVAESISVGAPVKLASASVT